MGVSRLEILLWLERTNKGNCGEAFPRRAGGWQDVSLLWPLSAAGNLVSSAASDKEGGECYPHLPRTTGFYHLSPYHWRTSVWGLRSHCTASALPCGPCAHSWIARESCWCAMLAHRAQGRPPGATKSGKRHYFGKGTHGQSREEGHPMSAYGSKSPGSGPEPTTARAPVPVLCRRT